MPTERVQCRAEGCTNTILPVTATQNAGYCMPCVQKRQRAERDEFIRQNRRTVNLYEGVTDPVEIIRILQTPRKPDPLMQLVPPPKSVEELYASLDVSQAQRLMRLAEKELNDGNTDFAEDIAKSLATLTDFPLDAMLEAWVNQNNFWPSIIFRGAGETIRDRILAAIEKTNNTVAHNHALCALAWIGDEQVCDVFLRWQRSPPLWRSKLHVGPTRYAHVAGWEPTEHGRHDLYHKTCLGIKPVEQPETAAKSVTLLAESSQTCRWCNAPLVNLLELDLADPRFRFLKFEGLKLPILTCEACTCFAVIFAKIDRAGAASWCEKNDRPSWLPEDISSWPRGPWNGVRLQLAPRRAIHAADWCLPVAVSQIGGLPSWVQDAAYPNCPDCEKTMTFIAQLDNAQFPRREGIYYAFLCADCRITATTYQQT